jgi:hypothetical protein
VGAQFGRSGEGCVGERGGGAWGCGGRLGEGS